MPSPSEEVRAGSVRDDMPIVNGRFVEHTLHQAVADINYISPKALYPRRLMCVEVHTSIEKSTDTARESLLISRGRTSLD